MRSNVHLAKVPLTARPEPPIRPGPAVFISSNVYRKAAFGSNHPLSGQRISVVMELCELLGWLQPGSLRASAPASERVLAGFHDADYIAALKQADACGQASRQVRERYRIGTMENPLFPGVFERAASTVGGSILAAETAMAGGVSFHPAGGTHHGRAGRANGFCYFNDPVFALSTFLNHGLERVLYVDLDAHHGDGVQDAFAADCRVMTLSIHEVDRWPGSGAIDDRGQGFARNLPVPRGFNDSELEYVMHNAVLPLARDFAPQALVITCGADGLSADPLSGMKLSNGGLWQAVLELLDESPRNVVLGGGGYNPWTTSRCWAGLWGLLDGRALPEELPPGARALLGRLSCDLVDQEDFNPAWLSSLKDDPHQAQIRPELVALVDRMLK